MRRDQIMLLIIISVIIGRKFIFPRSHTSFYYATLLNISAPVRHYDVLV
jgi:hypothetical protein